jgi:steroid 5-alpha reductase family enzyme
MKLSVLFFISLSAFQVDARYLNLHIRSSINDILTTVPRGGQNVDMTSMEGKEEEKIAFVPSLSAANRPTARISSRKLHHTLTKQLKEHFSDASITLQKLIDTQKPVASNILDGIRDKMVDIKSTHKDIAWENKTLQNTIKFIVHHRPNDDFLIYTAAFGLCLLGTSVGYRSFLYFVSVGYGISIGLTALVGLLVTNICTKNEIPLLSNIHIGLTVLWSIRLTTFLLHREYVNWPAWHWKLQEVHELSKTQKKKPIWFTCSAFYAMMITPCLFRMKQSIEQLKCTTWTTVGKIGILLQICGLSMESVADYQKGTFKRLPGNRKKWCNVGLWSIFTFPNYLGEIIFWIGTYTAGLDSFSNRTQWILATAGLLFSFTIIKGAIESLNTKHLKNYADIDGYLEWSKSHSFIGPRFSL